MRLPDDLKTRPADPLRRASTEILYVVIAVLLVVMAVDVTVGLVRFASELAR